MVVNYAICAGCGTPVRVFPVSRTCYAGKCDHCGLTFAINARAGRVREVHPPTRHTPRTPSSETGSAPSGTRTDPSPRSPPNAGAGS